MLLPLYHFTTQNVLMVTNWTINGGRDSCNLYHVSKDGAEYAERNINGTMGNLLNSYNQNRGYMDEPIRKRLTNADAESIAYRNIHGSMSNILHTQNERSIKSLPQPAPGIPRLKTSDALDIQNKSLNGSMSEILNISSTGGKVPGSQLNPKQVRAKSDDAKTNVEYGNNGTIGPLVLNPGSTNICEQKGKYEDKQRRAADAKSAPPAERVRSEAASKIAQHGKTGTFGILHGNSITPNDPKCKNYSKSVKQGFVASQQQPKPRIRNEAAGNNMSHGNVGKLGILLQGKPLSINSERNRYNEGVSRALKAETTQPVPRVRPEAADIANQHKGFVKNLIVDVSNKPKNIKKSASVDQLNYNRMKKKEREAQKKLQPSETKPLWKNSKYERTESRLKQWMDATYGAGSRPGTPATRPGSARAARPGAADKKPAAVSQNKKSGNTGLKKSASDSCLKRNFIAENAQKAKAAPIRVDPMKLHDRKVAKKKEDVNKSYQRGVVPDYLKERVSQWKEEERERIANLPDPTVPEGHVVMDQREKEETLTVLVKSREKLLGQLQNMPLRNDTLRLHNTRNELESKLGEIDDAIKIFSRPRVFIKQE
ncbi:hypothetical protein ACHWQZ_G016775 [Mnemiopsis leidyi]